MKRLSPPLLVAVLAFAPAAALASGPAAPQALAAPVFDPELAARTGADAHGMRAYVLVVLRTGPTPVAAGAARDAMFAGHFANMERLAEAGLLVLAGPFQADPQGWRGLFVLAVDDIARAREIVATDPVISSGEMVADYHAWYGSAATMLLPGLHRSLVPPPSPASPD